MLAVLFNRDDVIKYLLSFDAIDVNSTDCVSTGGMFISLKKYLLLVYCRFNSVQAISWENFINHHQGQGPLDAYCRTRSVMKPHTVARGQE